MRSRVERFVGWIGFALLLGSYALASFAVITATSIAYLLMNLAGAGIMGAISYRNKIWPALAIDLFWIGLTVAGMVKAL